MACAGAQKGPLPAPSRRERSSGVAWGLWASLAGRAFQGPQRGRQTKDTPCPACAQRRASLFFLESGAGWRDRTGEAARAPGAKAPGEATAPEEFDCAASCWRAGSPSRRIAATCPRRSNRRSHACHPVCQSSAITIAPSRSRARTGRGRPGRRRYLVPFSLARPRSRQNQQLGAGPPGFADHQTESYSASSLPGPEGEGDGYRDPLCVWPCVLRRGNVGRRSRPLSELWNSST